MKPKANRFFRSLPLLSVVIVAISATHAAAATYTWTQTAGGTYAWDTPANWAGEATPAPVSGDVMDLASVNILGNITLTLDEDRTATTWKFGDTVGTQSWTVNAGTPGGAMILAGTDPSISVGTTIITTINASIDGTDGLIKEGTGNLTLRGAFGHTVTGGITAKDGTLALNLSDLDTPEDLINASNDLSLHRATFSVTGKNAVSSQSLGNLTLNSGASIISLTANSGTNTLDVILGNTWTRNVGGAVNIQLNNGSTLASSPTLTHDIVGPWATIGTGTATRYATVSGGAIAPLTGTAAADASELTDTTGTVNYDLASAAGTTPDEVSANTIRYSGTAGTTAPGTTSFSVNGLTNAGTGLWTIGTDPVTIGADKDLVVNTANNSITISSIIGDNAGGASAITKTGAQTLTLSGANTYSGGMTLNAGTLRLGHNSALGSGTFTINGGTINDNGNTFTASTNIPVILNGNFSKADNQGRVINFGTGDVTLNTPITVTLTHPIQFGGTISGPGGLNALDITPSGNNNSQVILGADITLRDNQTVTTLGNSGTLTVNGILSDGGNGYGFTVNGSGSAGSVSLGNVTHTFTGPISLQNNGGLSVLGNISPSAITINSGSTLTLGNADLGQTGTISPATTLVNNGTFRIGQNRTLVQGVDFPSLITGTGGLTRGNHGTTVLNAQNTFTGSVTVSGNSGGFAIGADSVGTVGDIISGPLGRGTLVMNSQSVFSDSTTARTILNPVTLGGNAALGNATNNGELTLEDTVTLTGTRTLAINSTVNLNQGINPAAFGFTKTGNGTLNLNQSNTYGSGSSNNVTVNSGTLDVSPSGTFTANVGNLIVANAQSVVATLKLAANNSITATTQFALAQAGGGLNARGTVTTPDESTTAIYTPVMIVGDSKSGPSGGGFFTLGLDSSLTLEGTSGGRTALTVAQHIIGSQGNGAIGDLDLSAGSADLSLSKLVIALKTGTGGTASPITGTLTFNSAVANHLDISGAGNVVLIGSSASGYACTGVATLAGLDETSAIASTDDDTAVLLGSNSSGGVATGTLNFDSGTLTITTAGAAIAGGGGTSTLNLDGGATLIVGAASTNWIHGLTTAEIKSGGATIDTNGFDVGISQAFSGEGALTKAGLGTLTLEGVNTYTGNTVVSAGALVLADVAALNFAVSDTGSNKVTGAGSVTLAGDFTIDTTAVTLESGSWVLVDAATKSFTSTFTVDGWTESGNVWTLVDDDNTWQFSEATGTLTLNQELPPGNDYAAWDAQYPNDDLSDPAGDNDGDGLSNFEEYAFGLDPTSGASVNPITDISELSDGIFSYTRRASSGLTYTYWISTDLQDWGTEPAAVLLEEVGNADGNGVQTVDVAIVLPENSDKVFLRVKAE